MGCVGAGCTRRADGAPSCQTGRRAVSTSWAAHSKIQASVARGWFRGELVEPEQPVEATQPAETIKVAKVDETPLEKALPTSEEDIDSTTTAEVETKAEEWL